MNKKRGVWIICIFLFLLVAPFVFSLSNPLNVKVDFDELVKIDSVVFRRTNPTFYEVSGESTPATGFSKTFTISPAFALPTGDYILYVTASDIVGNRKTSNFTFSMEDDQVLIRLINPTYGVSNESTFDIIVETSTFADCKWMTDYVPSSFTDSDLKFFDETGEIEHTIFDYNTPAEHAHDFYVICKGDYVFMEKFVLKADITDPVIRNARFEPSPVVERNEIGQIQTKLFVETDEETVCRYRQDGSSWNWFVEDITVDSFAIEQNVSILLPDDNQANYEFEISCMDKAEHFSNVVDRSLEVNLQAPVSISVITPPRYSGEKNHFVAIETNKKSICTYSLDDDDAVDLVADETQKLHNSSEEISVNEGVHTLDILCKDLAGVETSLSYSFSVDLSPPSDVDFIVDTPWCSDDELVLELNASDDESGIAGFEYQVRDPSDNNISSVESSSSNEVKIDGLDLEDELTYTVVARAQNRAGLWGDWSESEGILLDLESLKCIDEDEPVVLINTSIGYSGATEVSLRCIDDTNCTEWSYGTSIDEDDCEPDTDYTFSFEITDLTYVCWWAKDEADRENEGGEHVVPLKSDVAVSCSNGVKDGNESDVDCGGDCPGCDNGLSCTQDSDCYSNYCVDSICEPSYCNDNITNGFETDVDCGGSSCDPCPLESSCLINSDCASNYCVDEVCEPSYCNDSIMNGFETDVDCGGPDCLGCPLGSSCNSDSDCQSGYCSFLRCEEAFIPEPEKSNFFSLILLILGVLMMLGGGGYILYKEYYVKPSQKAAYGQKPISGRAKQLPSTKPSGRRFFRGKGTSFKSSRSLQKSLDEKRKERERLFKQFGLEGKPSKGVLKPIYIGKTEEGPIEYIDISELSDLIIKKLKAKQGPDIFDKLTDLVNASEQKISGDAFENLENLFNKSKYNKKDLEGIKSLSKVFRERTSDAIIKDILRVSEEHGLDKTMLTLSLADLLMNNKLAKKDVANILFNLKRNGKLSKNDVSNILKKLGLNKK